MAAFKVSETVNLTTILMSTVSIISVSEADSFGSIYDESDDLDMLLFPSECDLNTLQDLLDPQDKPRTKPKRKSSRFSFARRKRNSSSCCLCSSKIGIPHALDCGHYLCLTCFEESRRGYMENKRFSHQLKCPVSNCRRSLSRSDVRSMCIYRKKAMEKKKPSFIHTGSEKIAAKLKRSKTTFCPSCFSAINRSTSHWVTCTSCSYRYCVVCKKSSSKRFHCFFRKVGATICIVLCSPVIVIGGIVVCACSLVESKIHSKDENTSLKVREAMCYKANSLVCWLVD